MDLTLMMPCIHVYVSAYLKLVQAERHLDEEIYAKRRPGRVDIACQFSPRVFGVFQKASKTSISAKAEAVVKTVA